jgi:hypothetical protein
MRAFLLAIGLLVMPSSTTPQDLARALLTAEGSAMPYPRAAAAARAARERPGSPVLRGRPSAPPQAEDGAPYDSTGAWLGPAMSRSMRATPEEVLTLDALRARGSISDEQHRKAMEALTEPGE